MPYPIAKVKEYLSAVIDPELNITIVDLGLIYAIEYPTPKRIKIVMTLTSMGCPLFHTIYEDVKRSLAPLGYSPDQVDIELVWDPPWKESLMTEKGKAEAGII